MHRVACVLVAVALVFFALSGSASAQHPLTSGEYIRSADSGWLKLEHKNGKLLFSLQTVGGNCHSCGLDGRVRGNIANGDDGFSGGRPMCQLQLTAHEGGSRLDVEPLTETCHQYCGARGSLDGTYRKPPKQCTKAAQRRARDQFTVLYRSKRYAQAIDALAPVLRDCEHFLGWIDIDRVRNDLALAQLRSGSPQQCLNTLEQTLGARFRDEDALRGALPPCDLDNYGPTAAATWHNLGLCSAAAR